jgi:hypothetical protein
MICEELQKGIILKMKKREVSSFQFLHSALYYKIFHKCFIKVHFLLELDFRSSGNNGTLFLFSILKKEVSVQQEI